VFLVLLVLAVLVAVAFRATTPEERKRFLHAADHALGRVADEVERVHRATRPFRDALGARTRWVLLTPTVIGLNLIVFVALVLEPGAISEPATLLAWGASDGPHTTNGEWWRLVTVLFVHAGMLQLVVHLIGLAQVSALLERLAGPVTIACTYLAAGSLGALVSISEHPLAVHAGATAAVLGLYGFLLGTITWGLLGRAGLSIPLAVFESLAPSAALFLTYSVVTGELASRPNLTGLTVGSLGGLLLTRQAGHRKPGMRTLAPLAASALALMVMAALPLRGMADIRPEISELVVLEDRTVNVYRAVVARFTTKQKPVDATVLTAVITGTILPRLTAARDRLQRAATPLAEHRPLVATAFEYLRLREMSWRLRVEGLRTGSARTLRQSEQLERMSREALQTLRGVRVTSEVHLS
jgi:rhomboid protease GluP